MQEIKPCVRRATEGSLIDTATLLAALARDDLLSDTPTNGKLAQAFSQLHNRPFRANISGINKVRNEYHVYMTDAQGKVVFDSANQSRRSGLLPLERRVVNVTWAVWRS